jgi:hypothetical protein
VSGRFLSARNSCNLLTQLTHATYSRACIYLRSHGCCLCDQIDSRAGASAGGRLSAGQAGGRVKATPGTSFDAEGGCGSSSYDRGGEGRSRPECDGSTEQARGGQSQDASREDGIGGRAAGNEKGSGNANADAAKGGGPAFEREG